MRVMIALLISLFVCGNALASDLSVRVVDASGAPIENAVITFTPAEGVRAPIRFDWAYEVAQRNLAFDPYILIVPVGVDVRFPNFDRVRHHVYSFSDGNRFELELFGRDETRSYRFRAEGVAAIGCNIHDQMLAYIVVVATPHVGRTGADGVTRITGVRGAGTLRLWHPDLRARGGAVSRTVTLPQSGEVQERFEVQLRTSAHAH